jgi:hypothetical protein
MVTESDLAPLLQAVPSYAQQWEQERAEIRPESRVHEITLWLGVHLADRIAVDDESELDGFFGAVDQLYREGDGEMDDRLTVGLLESLIHAAEDRGVDLARIAVHIVGPEARAGWEAAYAYTHSGGTPS